MSAVLGSAIPFAEQMPAGLIPVALADTNESFTIPGKEGLVILSDKPLSAEISAQLLGDDITLINCFLVRNNGIPPVFKIIDPSTWTLEIAVESCEKPTTFTLDVLNLEYAVNFQETYSKGNFDLWIAVHLPDSEFQFMIGTATQPVFNTEPQAFLAHVAHVGCISEASYTTFGIR